MADWDENNPSDSDIASQFPGNERSARAAVVTNFGIEHEEDDTSSELGYHKAVTLIDNVTDIASVADTCILYGKAVSAITEAFLRFEDGTVLQITSGNKLKGNSIDLFPAGTHMLFRQASAPTGWTQDTTQNDRVMRMVDGSGAGVGGSWTLSGVTVDGHVLTEAEMPAHTHTVPEGGTQASGSGYRSGAADNSKGSQVTGSVGSGNAHAHGLTSDAAWRPAYVDIISATVDA